MEYLWDPAEGQWFDYDVKAQCRKNIVSVSNFYPLWAGAAYPDQVQRGEKEFECYVVAKIFVDIMYRLVLVSLPL